MIEQTIAEMAPFGAKPAHPLGIPLMDKDHARLEQMLSRAAIAPDEELPALCEALVAELVAHFAREEEMMQTRGFPGLHCHSAQHKLLVEEARRVPSMRPSALRRHLGVHLATLVESHVLTLDTITAAYLRGEIGPASFDNLRLPVDTPSP